MIQFLLVNWSRVAFVSIHENKAACLKYLELLFFFSSSQFEIIEKDGIHSRRTQKAYYLTNDLPSGDTPCTLISSLLLNGENYDEWAINLCMAFS